MSSSEPLRVFISYACRDGAALAQRLQTDFTKAGFDAWLDTQRISGGAVWSTEIEHEINTRQVMIALLSPSSYTSEICRAEQLRALDKGNRVIPVLAVKGADRPLYLYARQYRDFTDDAHYASRLGELVADICGDTTATLPDTYRKTPVTYLTAPPRVANYLERPEALQALRDAVFAEGHRQPIALTALAGMGGIGKTVLAKALTEDEVVQRAFPDGIVWLTAGRERKRDFVEEMREVAKALGDDLSRYDNALACENQYRTTIASKAALIVVDDVWSKADIEPLLAESPRSRFLFTTRDTSIGRFVSAHEHRADLLDPRQSRVLLASWANVPVAELPLVGDEIIHECGHLPLALSVVGAMLRGTDVQFWKDTLDLLRKADLSAIEDQLPEGQQSFFKAVEVSFQSLKPEMQERYRGLAVLLEDMPASLPILQTLWNADRAEATRISKLFVDRSVAQRDVEGALRLHDLQLDYIRAKAADRSALEMILSATRKSAYVIGNDPQQYASQLLGRLLGYRHISAIRAFLEQIAAGTPGLWLRPLTPSLAGERSLRWMRPTPEESLNEVAFSPNAVWAAHASYREGETVLVLWNVRDWRCCGCLFRFPHSIYGLALSDDARSCVFSDSGGSVYHWQADRVEIREGRGHETGAIPELLAISADGCRAVSACTRGRLIAWNFESAQQETISDEPQNVITAISLNLEGNHIVSARRDGSMEAADLWALASRPWCRLGEPVTVLARSSDNSWLVIGTKGGRIEVRPLGASEPAQSFRIGEQPSAIAVSADGHHVAVGTSEGSITVWNIGRGERTAFYRRAHTWEIEAIAFTHGGRTVVSADTLQFKEWVLESDAGPEEAYLLPASGQVRVTTDGRHAVAVLENGELGVWDVSTGSLVSRLAACGSTFHDSRLRPREKLALAVSAPRALAWDEQLLCVWDLSTASCVGRVLGKQFADAAITADGTGVVYATHKEEGYGTAVWLWKPDIGAYSELGSSEDRITNIAISPDGELALASGKHECFVWHLTGDVTPQGTKRAAAYWVGSLRPSVITCIDSSNAVFGTNEGSVFSLKIVNGELRELNGCHRTWIAGLLTSRDGTIAVTSSHDETVRVWNVEEGRCTAVFDAHPGNLQQISASAQQLLLSSRSGVVKVLSLADGHLIAAFAADKQIVTCAGNTEFTRVVGIDERGQLHFLSLEGDA